MAVVVRYFSTSSAGAGDGTTWADRAALFSGGNWSTVITGFNFSGSDALECRIEGGITYTCSQALASGLFSNAPTAANPLILHGCDDTGARLEPSNPDWVSAQPVDWDTELPVIATSTNIATVSLAAGCFIRVVSFTASGRTGGAVVSGSQPNSLDWCVVVNSASNSSAVGVQSSNISNCAVTMSGTAFDYAVSHSLNLVNNCRIVATGSASSGNRRGVTWASFSSPHIIGSTILGFAGGAVVSLSTQVAQYGRISQSVLADNPGSAVLLASTSSQTATFVVEGCMVTGNGAYGINADASRVFASNSRLRDNTSGNFNGFGNYPTDLDNYTTDSDDATEYVDAAGGDYRIKYGSAIWGKGYGVADEPAPAGGGHRARLRTIGASR
jgi:hypothetical protein